MWLWLWLWLLCCWAGKDIRARGVLRRVVGVLVGGAATVKHKRAGFNRTTDTDIEPKAGGTLAALWHISK